jgi:predicted ribosomally synthesized peptide with SipW-like signal peptide
MNKRNKIYTILILIIVTFLTVGGTYSYFNSSTKMSSDPDLAKFVFNSELLTEIDVPILDIYPGAKQEYFFQVQNTDQDQTSDVTVEYVITIKTYHFMPLEIKLYYDEEVILVCDEEESRNEFNELVCKTTPKEFTYEENVTRDYLLEVTFDELYNTTDYKDIVDFLKIELNSYQKIKGVS